MDFKLKTTLVAAAVSSVLSSTAFAATLPTHQALPNVDHNATVARQHKGTTISKRSPRASINTQARAAKTPSLNGKGVTLSTNSDHFDRHLNANTFSWAKGQQKTASLPFSVLSRGAAIEQASRGYASQLGSKHGVSAQAFANAQLKYVSDNQRGAIISKYLQKSNGIEVYGRQFNVLMNQNMELVATTGYFSDLKAPQQSTARQFKLSASQAISNAFDNIGGSAVNLSKASDKANYEVFKASSTSHTFSEQPRSKKVYYPGKKTLIPAYYVEIMASEAGSKDLIAYSHVISAVDGKVLNRTNLVQSDSFTYKAFADSEAPFIPFDSPMGNDLTPHPTGVFSDIITEMQVAMNMVTLEHAGISTGDHWLASDATSTSGNNVDAYADLVAPDGFSDGDVRAQTTSASTFDYTYTHGDDVDTEQNLNASIVNLFYVNNYLHDVYYDHGFDEAAGVAQMDNFGRGGVDGDPIHAEAQDWSGINNATMATPADGSSPRMHMFLWSNNEVRDGTVDNPIIEHEWGHYISSRLTGGGMYANNQGGSMGEGWGDFFALITMVRQSDQALAGNDQWQAPYNDGGYAVANGFTEFPYFFGLRRYPYSTDMDHNALTFKHIQDQVALPTTTPISSLYSADFYINGVLNSEVHNAGEIWALSLWEAYAAMLNREGQSFADVQGRMMDYMVASMKITPFAPTYTEARDALLAVAIATDAEDYNVIRGAFAKRGMGVLAKSPDRWDAGFDGTLDSAGHAGVVESFDTNASSFALDSVMMDNAINTGSGAYCDLDDTLDPGESSMVKVTILNTGTQSLTGLKAMLSSSADVTFANGGMIDFDQLQQWNDTTTGMVQVTLNSADANSMIDINVSFMSDNSDVALPDDFTSTLTVNRDVVQDRMIEDFESASSVWADWMRTQAVDNGGADAEHFLSQWEVFEDVDFGNIAFGPNLSSQNDIAMVSPMVTVSDSGEFSVEFEHYYDFEIGDPNDAEDTTPWDGGVMEVSIDGGDWTDVVAAGGTFLTGYNGAITDFNPVLPGHAGFVGLIDSLWISPEVLTFADGVLNGKGVKFRFRIGSDGSVASWGWNIDNLAFSNATNATPFSSIAADSGVCSNRTPHVTSVTAPAEVIETQSVSITATGHDHDATELAFIWSQTEGSTAIDVSSTAGTLTFDAPLVAADETYTFSVMSSDGELTSMAKTVSVMIKANAAPIVTTEQGAVSINEMTSVTLMVNGADAENNALTYQWTIDGQAIDNAGSSYTYAAPDVAADRDVEFSVTAFDGFEHSAATTMTVSVIANLAPVVTAAQSSVTIREKEVVTLSVTATDNENDSLTYQWTQDGVALANTGTSLEFTAPDVSQDTTIAFSVTAFDGQNHSEAAQISVTVENRSNGGGMGLFALLLAPLVFIRRRKQR
jgi:hypothetical protein